MLTRTQQYAATIYRQVKEEVESQSPDYRKRYGTMAHKLPVLVRTAGLAQALAFVESRGKPEYGKLLTHLGAAVEVPDLVERSRAKDTDLAEYMRLTRKVQAALEWYKRFAESVLRIDRDQAEGDDE